MTYSINSLCHFFGQRRFPTGDESRNLAWLAPFTFGESWHNNHHAFPTSAAHGLRRWELDISAAVIWVLERLGLAWDVVRVPPERQAAKLAAERSAMTRRRRDGAAAHGPGRGSARAPFHGRVLGRHRPAADQRVRGPTFTLTSPRALGHVLRAPGQLGVGRAYVTGGVEVDDIDAALYLLDSWQAPPLDARSRLRLAAAAVRAGALRALPHVPAAELRPTGRRHSYARDRRAVRHHYDVSNEFFALFLDESMTYSCAIFSRGAKSLAEAQETKVELVCRSLRWSRGSGCSTSAAVGAASRSTPPASTASM